MTTLALSRKVDESIWIGNSCQIYVAQIESIRQVRLAIDAPRFIQISRSEKLAKATLPLEEQIAASVIDCLRLNGINDQDHTIAICDLCNSMIDVIGGLRNAS